MRVLSTYGLPGTRGDVELVAGLAAQSDTIAAVAEGSAALVAGDMMLAMLAGGWL